MSMSTTSASSLEAIQCAAVAPTFPEPTTVTFLRMKILSIGTEEIIDHGAHRERGGTRELFRCGGYRCAHVLNNRTGKLAGCDFSRAFHQPLEVVGHFLLLDGALQTL